MPSLALLAVARCAGCQATLGQLRQLAPFRVKVLSVSRRPIIRDQNRADHDDVNLARCDQIGGIVVVRGVPGDRSR
jgi:hypothetical protein